MTAIILPAQTLADTGYSIDNSCRFDDGDSAYLSFTPSGAGNRQTWTFSCWVKRGNLLGDTRADIFSVGHLTNNGWSDTTCFELQFGAGGTGEPDGIRVLGFNTIWLRTNRVFRDPSAWYHIVVAFDATQSTATDRLKLYINGTEETSFGADS